MSECRKRNYVEGDFCETHDCAWQDCLERKLALAMKVVEAARVFEESGGHHPITYGVARMALRDALREFEEGK